MKILFTLAHYYDPKGSGKHGSLRRSAASDSGADLLPQRLAAALWSQAMLREHLGQFDYYCFLEDDLIPHDPWFFVKLRWFNKLAGNECLLQPNLYEVSGATSHTAKAYVDGDLAPHVTAPFQNVHDRTQLAFEALGQRVYFRRPLNPHAACYFLNAEQMAHWAKQKYFLDRDASFVDPMASAATLGIMKTFRVYKPASENASFLEILHFGTRFISLIGKEVRWAAEPEKNENQGLTNSLPPRVVFASPWISVIPRRNQYEPRKLDRASRPRPVCRCPALRHVGRPARASRSSKLGSKSRPPRAADRASLAPRRCS